MSRILNLWWRFVAYAFHEFYNRFAFTYDFVSRIVSVNSWKDWQLAGLRYLPDAPATILEIAHGTGDIQIVLHERGYQTIGMDLSASMGWIAARKMRSGNIQPVLVQGNAHSIPMLDLSVDGVICTFPTAFIFQRTVWKEISRVLRAEASAVVVIHASLTGRNPLVMLLEWAYRITGQRSGLPENIVEEISSCGFAVELLQVEIPGSVVTLLVARKNNA
jgi:ubiquinone/menaquinone biosynthesis C-methylase UbiE